MKQQQENAKKKIVFALIPILIFLVFISYLLIRTCMAQEVRDAVTETNASAESLGAFSDSFEGILEENLYGRYEFINLNGLTTRALWINSLNDRQKMPNGHLTDFADADDADPAASAASVIELNAFLTKRDIDFVYLLAPNKRAFYDASFAPGYSDPTKQSFDEMIELLDAADVATVDMNTWYEENEWTMDDVYYRTDHHWTPPAAMAAAKETMDVMLEQNMIDGYDADLLEQDSYTIVTKENWFLGSHGKRVGIYYAGLDDLSVYFPNFATDYTFARLTSDTTNWSYADSPLNLEYIEAEKPDYFNKNPYCTYLYGDEPVRIAINRKANNKQKVLVVGDSFKNAWGYFMTTQFQEMYFFDPRHYTDGSFVQFVADICPDIVIMCVSEPVAKSYYSFGTEEYLTALEDTSQIGTAVNILSDATLNAQENTDHFTTLTKEVEPGQPYTLTVDSTSYSGGEDLFVQMTLQDLSTNEAVCNRYFDANSDEPQKWIFTVPDDADTYAIYLYAGTKGHTADVSVEVTNIRLREGVFEE